jgi:hypothetical protein
MEKGNGNGRGREARPATKELSLAPSAKRQNPEPGRVELSKEIAPVGALTVAAGKVVGGKRGFYDLVKQAVKNHPAIQPFVDYLATQTPYALYKKTIEELADASGVQRRAILEAVAGVQFDLGYDLSHLIVSQQLPTVVERSIKVAKTTRGFKDRELLMKHSGFIPVPSGSVINLNQKIIQAQSQRDAGLDSFEDTLRKNQERAIEVEIVQDAGGE